MKCVSPHPKAIQKGGDPSHSYCSVVMPFPCDKDLFRLAQRCQNPTLTSLSTSLACQRWVCWTETPGQQEPRASVY